MSLTGIIHTLFHGDAPRRAEAESLHQDRMAASVAVSEAADRVRRSTASIRTVVDETIHRIKDGNARHP